MTLTDPREALADQSHFIDYLVGLAGIARTIHDLAADGDRRAGVPRDADDFVFALLGLVSVGTAIERLTYPPAAQQNPIADAPGTPIARWLR